MKKIRALLLLFMIKTGFGAVPQPPTPVVKTQQVQPVVPMPVVVTQPYVMQKQPLDLDNIPIPSKIVSGKHEIQINSSLPLKGEAAILGSQVFDGMSLYFNKIKTEQHKAAFFYSLNVLDDHADIKKTRENIDNLMKQSPLFLCLLGTETIAGIINYIMNGSILALFPLDGASAYRKPQNKNLIYLQASFAGEIDALVYYAINTLNKKKFAVFYEGSEWGEGVLEDCKRVLKKYKLTLVAQASYPQDTLNISKAVESLASKAPNAILCFAQARPAYNFIRQIINKGLLKTVMLGPSTLIPIQNPLKKSRGVQIITSSVVPDPERSTMHLVQEYRADMKKYLPNKTLSPFSLIGYQSAAIFYEATKDIPLPLTMAKIRQRFEQLKNVVFKQDRKISFDDQTRTLSKDVWLNTGANSEWSLAFAKPTASQRGTS